MKSDDNLLPVLLEKLTNDFALENKKHSKPERDNISLEEIKRFLKERIIVLMEKNFEKFLNTLYRIDLPENKVEQIFSKEPSEKIPELIADLIIERQIQRIKTREIYKSGRL